MNAIKKSFDLDNIYFIIDLIGGELTVCPFLNGVEYEAKVFETLEEAELFLENNLFVFKEIERLSKRQEELFEGVFDTKSWD